MSTRIGLFGAAGHMGITLIRAISESDFCTVAGGCERTGSPHLGEDLGTLAGLRPLGLAVTDDIGALCEAADVVVDYSAASATMSLVAVAVARRTPVLVCTTGFTESQRASLVEAGQVVPILVGANMSRSVIVMYQLVKTAARLLGDEFDIEIFDFHPWDKIDAPSGTALELAEHAAEGRGVALEDVMAGRKARRDRQAPARRHRLFVGSGWGRARRELGVLRRPGSAPRDHKPSDGPPGVRWSDAGRRRLARKAAARLLRDGGHGAGRELMRAEVARRGQGIRMSAQTSRWAGPSASAAACGSPAAARTRRRRPRRVPRRQHVVHAQVARPALVSPVGGVERGVPAMAGFAPPCPAASAPPALAGAGSCRRGWSRSRRDGRSSRPRRRTGRG